MEILMGKEKLLIIQTAFIGDSILTLPMIQKLKELYPESLIDVICHPLSQEIFQLSPFISNVIVYDKRGKNKGLLNILKFAKMIKNGAYSRIYAPHRSTRTSILVKLSGVNETYGFSNSELNKVYSNIVEYRKDYHEVQRNLSLIGYPVENQNWKIQPELLISAEIQKKIDEFVTKYPGRKFAAVAPGSVWETKKYPKENYAKIIRYLLDQSFHIFLVGGGTDRDYCEEIAANFSQNVINTAGRFSIVESICLLKKCSMLVSNDSAPTHFAMCAGIPVLTIFCSTIPGFGFYPYSTSGKYISYDDLSCKPCGIHGHQKCPVGTFDCAKKIDIEKILSTISEMCSV